MVTRKCSPHVDIVADRLDNSAGERIEDQRVRFSQNPQVN